MKTPLIKRCIVGSLLALAASAAGAAPPAQTHQTLVYCSDADPTQLQPALAGDQTSLDAGSRQIFDRLLRLRTHAGRQVLEPALATSWKISPDGRTYTLQLRRGVHFQSNYGFTPTRDFNAQDVVFSFQRMMDSNQPYHEVSGGDYRTFRALGLQRILRSVEAQGPYTVRFVLDTPDAPFLANLAMDFASINSAEYAAWLQQRGRPADLDRKPLGTGPFELVGYTPGVSIRYRAFARYWRGAPRIQRLVFAITPDPSKRWARLRDGTCQVMAAPDPAELPAMRADPRVRVASAPGSDISYLAFNMHRPPLDNVLVRRALALAIDKRALVARVWRGNARVAVNPLPPTLWSYDRSIPDTRHDPAEARRLLAKAGFPRGFDTEIWIPDVSRPYLADARLAARLIQADWAAIGVRARIVSRGWSDYVGALQRHQPDTALLGWAGNNGDPDYFLGNLLSCDAAQGLRNAAGFCDAAYQRAIEQARLTTDRAQRTRLYHQAQRVFQQQLPWITLAYPDVIVPMSRRVHGYVLTPNGGHEFASVWLQ